MFNHSLDEFAHDKDPSPVAAMDDNVPLAAKLRELLSEVIDKVAFLDCGTKSPHSNILDASAYSFVSSTFS